MQQTVEHTETISLTERQWILRDADERHVAALAQKHGLPDILARIMAARGVALEEAEAFLSPSLKHLLPDPSHLLDMDAAAERVAGAVMSGERIAIFGDYDVDGATSSALLTRFLRALGHDPFIHIPDRMKEGYGPNAPALLALKARGATLVITVDCGTMAFEPLQAAHEAGLDVIVIDHHIGEARKPKCYALVNPNRLDETSPLGHLAAVGMAFMLAVAVNRTLRAAGYFAGRAQPDIRQWLDLVALGTVCDVVPLTGLNRAFVLQGLKVMAARGNVGIRTLFDSAAISEKPGVYHAGFVLGPRINAGGRVGKSDLGVRLLITEDEAEAKLLAAELELHNGERKAIEAMVHEEAMLMAEAMHERHAVIVVAGKGWHPGVIGIVAGRIKERFHKPVAVIAVHDGIGKASARSVTGIDFGAAVIAACDSGLLLGGGGHAMAAGFSVEEDKIPALAAFLSQRMQVAEGEVKLRRRLLLDGMLSISGATPELVAQLDQLGPFGQGNPSIRVVIHNVVNLKSDVVGEHHVKTLFIDRLSNARLSGIAFRVMGTALGDALLATRGQTVDIAGQLRLQVWNGKETISLTVDDIAQRKA
jgi:single-stranded-DNA-specific exonuclease